jgi:hypothetical protein
MYTCPENTFGCGTPLQKNLSLSTDHLETQGFLHYGMTTFDNLPLAFVSIF